MPDISELRKRFDEHHNDIWETYVLRQQKILKNKRNIEKKKHDALKKKQEDQEHRLHQVHVNLNEAKKDY